MRRNINPKLKQYLINFNGELTIDELLPKVNKIFNENYSREELQKYLARNKIKYKYKNKNKSHKMGLNKPIGSEYTKPDGMVMIKVAPNKWEYKQRYIYEQYYGIKVKDNEHIIFLDGNKNNFNIDNLEKTTNEECGYIGAFKTNNKLAVNDKEITKTLLLMAKMNIKTKEIRKEKEEMANIWKKLNKLNKSNYEIAKETNIPEEKVEEIMKGERQVPSNMIDDFRKALATNNRVEKSLKLSQVKEWYKTTDLKQRREDLGYKSQASLSRAMNVSPSTISRIESKSEENRKYFNEDMLVKYYDFMTNDLNKVIYSNKKIKKHPKEKYVNFEEVKEWYKNFDVKQWLYNKNWHNGDLARTLGYKSSSSITDVLNGTRTIEQSRNVLTKLYLYVKEEEKNKLLNKYDNENIEIIKDLEEDIEVLDESDITSNIEYHNEPVEPKCIIRPSSKEGTIIRLEQELEEAKKQIARYEKLIDMIGANKNGN